MCVKESLSYEDVPIEILDHQVWELRNKEVASAKVLWRNKLVDGATCEAEADMIPVSLSLSLYFSISLRY